MNYALTEFEARVLELLEYLDSEPECEAALPFAVAHGIEQLREAADRMMPAPSLTHLQRGRLRRTRAGYCSRANLR